MSTRIIGNVEKIPTRNQRPPPKIKWAPTITCGRGPCVGSAREHLFPIVDVDKHAADAGVESVA